MDKEKALDKKDLVKQIIEDDLHWSQEDLYRFLKEIAQLVLKYPVKEPNTKQLAKKVASVCILIDDELLFGMPIAIHTDEDEKKLRSAIETYMQSIS